MSESFGNGVSRTLSALSRQFDNVVWQKGKPPLDSELNLMSQIDIEKMQELVRAEMNSGFIIDPTVSMQDFQFHKDWSNFFKMGVADGTHKSILYANVGGMVIPVSGTNIDTISNMIKLSPPPESDGRVDFVFLECWKTLVAPNPSTLNKPSADMVYKYGNVEYGGTNIIDDLEDPNIGFETTERVQVQYRIRVYGNGVGLGSGVALQEHPDGLGDPNILGQGTASSPIGGFSFHNMKNELSDPSLWRAGDGDPTNALGTIDGYVYAIPICAVFRRNSNPFVATNISGNPNQNGGFERTPSSKYQADPRESARILAIPTLVNDLSANYTGVVQVNDLIGSGVEDSYHTITNVPLIIGNEIVSVSAIDTNSTPNTITISQRGRYGTASTGHSASTRITFYNTRADGRFSDEITMEDVLDLRRSVTMGEWDYHRILQNNLASLMKGELHSTFKRSAIADTEGTVVTEVSYLYADGTTDVPNHTEPMDGADGIRTVFSDSAVIERDVAILLDNEPTLVNGSTQDQFDTTVGWDTAPDFKPSGFMNNDGASGSWTNGSLIFLHIGGENGTQGARDTFRDGAERAVRFLTPKEYWKGGYSTFDSETFSDEKIEQGNQYPVTLRFVDQPSHLPMPPSAELIDSRAPQKHPGPMFPSQSWDFMYPYIVLGGVLHPSLKISNVTSATQFTNLQDKYLEIDIGIDFDALGGFYSLNANGTFDTDPTKVATPLFHGEKTLYEMLTVNGQFSSGQLSEVYVVLYGDTNTNSKDNNGVFKVIGAGTVGYTDFRASNSTSIVVAKLDADYVEFDTTSTGAVTIEFRSQFTHSLDGNGLVGGSPSLCIGLTDIGGDGVWLSKWTRSGLDTSDGGAIDNSLPTDTYDGRTITSVPSKMVISTTLIYEPNRGATARVADRIDTIAMENADSTFLRQSKGVIDNGFSTITGAPSADVEFLPTHIQLWNRLSALGWHAPLAPSYGGKIINNSEQDRECETFYDRGSKTLVFRPYRSRRMTLQAITTPAIVDGSGNSYGLQGKYLYPNGIAKDGLSLFTGNATSGKKMGYAIPQEYMPRFGRQDIPFVRDGLGTFLFGINHLFVDSTELNNEVFKIIGGEDNISGGALVKPLYFRTNAPAKYGESGTVIGGALNKPYYEARKSTDIGTATADQRAVINKFKSVRSSDFGNGLKGIQLPPYLGVARIYGVYDYEDYLSKGGQTYLEDRVTAENDPATNLLRQDNHTQSLFIMQDGALDLTGETGDHTYVIPSNAIDISLSPNHTLNGGSKERFEDFDYVVECVVFGFSKDWINGNNYVLSRKHHSQGELLSDGDNEQLEDITMVFPCPAPRNSRLQMTYNRTVYQGDPYLTRYGNVKTISDYERRYGQVSSANSHQLSYPIQQFDDNGNSLIEMPNKKVFQVLASVDFYTTMGTGKIGGKLHTGTFMDVGYLDNTRSRVASSESDNRLQVMSKAFTESQLNNPNKASLVLKMISEPLQTRPLDGHTIAITRQDGVRFAFSFVPTGTAFTNTDYLRHIEYDLTDTQEEIIEKLEDTLNYKMAGLINTCYGIADGDMLIIQSVESGASGNGIKVEIVVPPYSQTDFTNYASRYFRFPFLRNKLYTLDSATSSFNSAYLSGGVDLPMNGGDGVSQINLTGMTERLPLGILLNDSDFLCENPLNDSASAVQTFASSIRPLQTTLPLTEQGEEVTRFMGVPSEYIALSDGGVLNYTAFDQVDRPTGTKKYRVFRGGGSAMLVSGRNPGGPLDFLGGSLSAPLQPVLKGGALVGKALLVKNFEESIFDDPLNIVSNGEEIQMVIITTGVMGNPNTQRDGIVLGGEISPTGYGEGYSSADRYRLVGKPMFAPNSQKKPSADIDPIPYLKDGEE